jgi:hypothetical protein
MPYYEAVHYSMPPVDAVAPPIATQIFGGASILLSLVVLVWALIHTRKYKSTLPLWLFVAACCSIVLESVVCHMGHCWHSVVGQDTLYTNNGVSVPKYLLFSYCFYFGLVYMALFPKIVHNNFTMGFVWKAYFAMSFWAAVVEIYVVHTDLWIYYGNQALWVWKGTLPLFSVFVNSACIFTALTLIKVFYPVLTGWKQPLVVVLSPLGAYVGHFGAGFPYYTVVNSAASQNQWLVELSGIACLLLSLLLVFLCGRILSFGGSLLDAAAPKAASRHKNNFNP